MFARYHLEDPISTDQQTLGGWSYVWAGLFGPLYVLLKGFALRAFAMLAAGVAIVVAADALADVFAITTLDGGEPTFSLAMLGVFVVMLQAVVGVELVRRGYLRFGYRERAR